MKAKKKRLEEVPMEVDEEQSPNPVNMDNEQFNCDFAEDEEGGYRIGDIYIPPPPAPAMSLANNGSRLVIKLIVNNNFKSYAGVQVLGPFHKSFTAIIGPNGSGKSNVIDSMLFVFGYRATKIRSKKISVLLHSSSKYPNVSSASVAVHFCEIVDEEGENFTEVPNSEIIVSRTAFKDNSSFYTLNGRRVQFKEVAKMLRSFGIDLDHNRFLILQGEVEQIAMMKPKAQNEHDSGMLEYLEDIIGTSRYKEPLEKLDQKIEEYSEMRKEKLNRVRLVEQEKVKLEAPMHAAVNVVNLTNNVTKVRNVMLQKYIHEANKIIASKTAELDKLKENLAKIDENINNLKQVLEEKTGVLKAGSRTYETLRKQKEEVTEKMVACKKKAVTAQSDLTQSNKKRKNLEQLLEQERGKLIDLELIPEKNLREIEECERLQSKHQENKKLAEEQLQEVVASVRTKTQGLQERKDVFQAKLIGLKKIVDEANKNYKLAESELKIYVSTEKKEIEKWDKIKEAYEKAVADFEEKEPQQGELAAKLPEQEKKLDQVQAQMQMLKKEEVKITAEARKLRGLLEESRQAMTANRSRGRVLDALMKEKNNGTLPGIFGRLGDLGGIDNQYDVAISTCCGALDNIVVDTVETAQACVEHLKRHDIGRATFIALDKQHHLIQHMQRSAHYPENAPRLFDLVRVKDERVLPAFYYGLRDTLVAKDLEQASRIAYGHTRYRVVTLNGDVIEIAGTMSGGGKTMMRGKMSNSVQQDTSEQDPAVIQGHENKLSSLEAKLSNLRKELSELEELSVTLQRTIREGRTTLNKLNIEVKSLQEQLPIMKNQIKLQKDKVARSKVDPVRQAELEGIMSDAKEKLDRAKKDAGEVEKQVHGVDAEISAVAGGEVKELQTIVDDLTKKLNKITTEITKLKVAINTSKRNAKKSKDKIQQMDTDLKETENNIERLNTQKKELTLQIQDFEKQAEELQEKISEGTGEFSELKQEINKLQTKENKMKSERLEATNAISKMEKSIGDCASKKPQWERELASLRMEDPGIEGVPGLESIKPLELHSPEVLEEAAVDELRHRHSTLVSRIGEDKPDIQAILDYKDKEELYLKRAAELEEITTKRNEIREVFEEVKHKRKTDFLTGFSTITAKLKEMYQMITLGGDAELELVDSMDPFLEGVTFSVRPPSKSWKNISNLSGGEKTLSSLALVFALHYYKPTPLYVMDEIDAALDFKNVSIVANYIKERTKNAQFIIISLRYNMFEVSNRLVGIYKTEDCTKSLTIENKVPETENNILANNDM